MAINPHIRKFICDSSPLQICEAKNVIFERSKLQLNYLFRDWQKDLYDSDLHPKPILSLYKIYWLHCESPMYHFFFW